MKRNTTLALIIYFTAALASGVGFVTQMLVTGFWTAAFGNEVKYYSFHVATYFLSLGLGSLSTQKFHKPRLRHLFGVLLGLSLLCGCAIPFLRWVCTHFIAGLDTAPLALVGMLGVLAGQVLPLAVRVAAPLGPVTLGRILLLDYLAALGFCLVFIFICLAPLGFGKTGVLLSWTSSLLTALAAAQFTRERRSVFLLALVTMALPLPLHRAVRAPAQAPLRDLASERRAKIVLSHQSPIQRIVLTEEAGDNLFYPGIPQHFLYLDGLLKFSSRDEQAEHACFVNTALKALEHTQGASRKALVLGGGDGMVTRNLLSVPKIKKIDVIEQDADLLRMGQSELSLRIYNLDSLRNPRVNVKSEDPFRWAFTAQDTYDLIFIQFPVPRNLALSRLYSAEFYSALFKKLNPKGVLALQAGPAFEPGQATSEVLSAMVSSLQATWQLLGVQTQVFVNSRQNEAFLLVAKTDRFPPQGGIGKPTARDCFHNPTWKVQNSPPNTLNRLVLSQALEDYFRKSPTPLHNYRAAQSVFLPH